jgi:5-methylcytosine-specific restriction endonuclease McrA
VTPNIKRRTDRNPLWIFDIGWDKCPWQGNRLDRSPTNIKSTQGIFMSKGCTIKIKGGDRCGKPLIPGKKFCKDHAPLDIVRIAEEINRKIEKFGSLANAKKSSKFLGANQYQAYIQSSEWKERSRLERIKNPACSLCNKKGILVVHHRTYERLGNEANGDLIVLCKECHELFHQYYEYKGKSGHFVKK